MSLDRQRTDHAPKTPNYRQWPGERHPTRWDVHDANESPAVTFLERFRVALLHSEGSEEEALQDSDLLMNDSEIINATVAGTDSTNVYTYPMALLSDVPALPPEDELARLQESFYTSFKTHIFINAIDVAGPSGIIPPYLRLALASIASVTSTLSSTNDYVVEGWTSPASTSAGLFIAGVNLWSVMLEVDNREARLLEAVLAASLLITYGILSADSSDSRRATGLLSNVATIARRLHLTDGYPSLFASGEISEREFSMKSSLMSYMVLTDVIHAVHHGTVPNYSISELSIRMPSTNHQFRTIYNSLAHGHALPPDITSSEDGLLLLTALLSDIIYLQRCQLFLPFPSLPNYDGLRNPYAPLSSRSEFQRLGADMMAALSRWDNHFQGKVDSSILALYYFSKLHLACPALWELPHMAGYRGTPGISPNQLKPKNIEISDKSMDFAWLVLDHCDKSSKSVNLGQSIWLPIILFISALVVWQRLRSQIPTDMKYGTLKVLSMFKNEIARLPWPCCVDMVRTLDRLMEN